MRILLLLAKDSTYRRAPLHRRCVSYAPLTLPVLAALVPRDLGARVDIVDEGVQLLRDRVGAYDVVGISCVTSSAPRAYALADRFRATGARVVIGGYHASLNPEEAAAHADAVVVGPAEVAWPRILREIHETGRPSRRVYGERVPDCLSMPVPVRLPAPPWRYVPIPTVLASRGCGNACAFCVVNRVWERQPCPRPVAEVIEEVRALRSKRVIFLDSNVIADREHAAALFEALVPLGKRWSGAATMDLAGDEDLLDLAVRSGCEGLLVGFESVNASSLEGCGKRTNRVGEYLRRTATLHARGVAVLGCFVLGFDSDDEDVFDRTISFIDEAGIDLPRFSVLTPFPGTPFFDQLKAQGRILTDDWTLYDEHHVVFQPAKMSPEALEAGFQRVWSRAFSPARIVGRAMRSGARAPIALATNVAFSRIPAALER